MNYDAGVKLYILYGNNATLKRVLTTEAETPFKQQKLREALTQILNTAKPAITTVARDIDNLQPSQVTQTNVLKSGWPSQPIEDTVIAALYNRWRPLYGEMKSLQHRIDDIARQAETDRNKLMEAGQMAFQILDLEDEILTVYYDRDYYYQNNRLPATKDKEEMPVVDPVKWMVELEKHKRYVRRYTKKISDNPNNKNVPNWADLLKKSVAMVAHYKKLLKIDE